MLNKKPKSYAWRFKNGKVNCYASDASSCKVTKLWEAAALTSFHDAELAQATKEINGILTGLKRANREPDRQLSFIQIQDRHLLAWTTGVAGPHDDDEVIRKKLRLKTR